jgi:hypothetical protein
MLSTAPTPQNRASRGRARGLKTRVGGFCRRPATRARRFARQAANSHRVARVAARKTASGCPIYAGNNPLSLIDPSGFEPGSASSTALGGLNSWNPSGERYVGIGEGHVQPLIQGHRDPMNALNVGLSVFPVAATVNVAGRVITTTLGLGMAANGDLSGLALSLPGSAAASRVATVATPHGLAVQADTAAARAALQQAQSGATVYRQGSFGVQNTADAQFWSFNNPARTPGYSGQMGMPGGAAKPDWIMGGTVRPGSPVITRPAPGIGTNTGGNMEAVVPPGGVGNTWFHMPD